MDVSTVHHSSEPMRSGRKADAWTMRFRFFAVARPWIMRAVREIVARLGSGAMVVASGLAALGMPMAHAGTPSSLQGSVQRLARVKSWAYQLHGVSPAEIAASPHDLVVIDYSRNGRDARRFTAADVKLMQAKPDGARRLVIAYLSIGEAEDHRYYWKRGWVEPAPRRQLHGAQQQPFLPDSNETVRIPRLIAPAWLGRENDHWRGSYQVRFWHDEWKQLIMHDQASYLSRIVSAGFDGVYLTGVDIYTAIERDTDTAKDRMVGFVVELATIARQQKADFIVVPQNAEELLADQRYLGAIDGIAKEDLIYGGDGDGLRNSAKRIGQALRRLSAPRLVGLPVLAVEYLREPRLIEGADAELRARGFLPFFGTRGLDRLGPLPATVSGSAAAQGEMP